jgi:LEA14-like dessication related protein
MKNEMRQGALAAVLLLAVTALAGCSLIIEEPVVRVTDVQAASIGLTGGTLRVVVELENPNRFGLVSNVFNYRLELAEEPGTETTTWLTLFDGEREGMVEVPSRETARVEVEVPFEYASVGVVIGRLLRQGELEYRFSGSLEFRTPIGGIGVPFDERGTFRP